MRRILSLGIVLTLTLVLSGESALAGGIFFASGEEVAGKIEHQRAIVIWDGVEETIVVEDLVKSESIQNFCWLIPIKSSVRPRVELMKGKPFDIFEDMFVKYGFHPPWPLEAPVLERETVFFNEMYPYNPYLIHTTDADELMGWLEKKGYLIPDKAARLFHRYTEGGCYFAVNQMNFEEEFSMELLVIQEILPEDYEPFMKGEQTLSEIKAKLCGTILRDMEGGRGYEYSVAKYFMREDEYWEIKASPYEFEVMEKIENFFSELEEGLKKMHQGLCSPMKITFRPNKPTYPLYISKMSRNMDIDIYFISPYREISCNIPNMTKVHSNVLWRIIPALEEELDMPLNDRGCHFVTKFTYRGGLEGVLGDAVFDCGEVTPFSPLTFRKAQAY